MKFELAGKPAYSPTKPLPDVVSNESPHPSPSRAEHDVPVMIFLRFSLPPTYIISSHMAQGPTEMVKGGTAPELRTVLWTK